MDSHILLAPDLPPVGLHPSSGAELREHDVDSSSAPHSPEAAAGLQDQIPGYEDEPLVQEPVDRTILAPTAAPALPSEPASSVAEPVSAVENVAVPSPDPHTLRDAEPKRREAGASAAADATVRAPQAQDRIPFSKDKPAAALANPDTSPVRTVPGTEAIAPPPASMPRAPASELTMPDEDSVEAAPAAQLSTPSPPTRTAQQSTRNVLLGTAGALGLTMLLAGSGFYALTHRSGATSPIATAANIVTMPQAVRPSEALAANQAGSQATDTGAAQTPIQPAHAGPGTNKAAQTHKADAADMLGLKSDAPADASPLAPVVAPEAAASARPAAAPEAPAADKPAASAAVASPPQGSTQAVAMAARGPGPTDAADVAAALVPAPMSSQQTVDVLSVVTQLGALVRDMRSENAQLRTQVATLSDTVSNKTMDFEQRLGLAEARGSVAAAMGAGRAQASAPTTVIPAVVTVSGAHTLRAMAVTPVSAPVRSARDYRVQAASPGLAVLSDAGAAPGQAAGLQVSVGDEVPGVGRITSIRQRGSTWVVQTDHGAIQ